MNGRVRAMALGAVGCFFLTVTSGCMISPENNENIGDSDANFSYAGFTVDPGASVEVQAFNNERRRWETVVTTTSGQSALAWQGRDWYYWQTSKIRLERAFWYVRHPEDINDHGAAEATAQVRALSNGRMLYTFDDWRPGDSPNQMASKVNGNEVQIHSLVWDPRVPR